MNRCCLLFVLFFGVVVSSDAVHPVWKVREPEGGSVATDQAGNVYLVQWSYEDRVLTVAKRGSNGRRIWSTSLPDEAFAGGITVDAGGSVYLVGGIIHPDNPTNVFDVVTWRFDAAGQLLWRVVYAGPENTDDSPIGIGSDEAGRVYVVARSFRRFNPSFTSYLDFVSYDANGSLAWSRRFEVAPGGSLNTGTAAFNPRGGVAAATASTVISCASDGELLWSWRSEDASFVAAENDDYFLTGFDRHDHLYVGGGTGQRSPQTPAVRKFSPTGAILWTSPYLGPAEDPGLLVQLQVDDAGNAYIGIDAPIACHSTIIDEDPELVCDSRPAVVKFSPDGAILWASRFSANPAFQYYFTGLAVETNGRVTLAARAYRLKPADLNPEGNSPIAHHTFLGQCDADGNQIWNGFFHYDSARELWPFAPWVNAKGSIYLQFELIDRRGSSDIDLLLAKFHPFQLRHAPRIQRPPAPQTVTTGGTANFAVQASGRSRLRYQWLFNSVPLPGKTGPSLTLDDVRLEQAGDYSVQVRSAGGQIASPEARLTVMPIGN